MRLSGVYLAMLTLAFAQIVWSIVFQWDAVTGGSNGLVGVWPAPWLAGKPAYYYSDARAGASRAILCAPRASCSRRSATRCAAARDSPLRCDAIGIDVQRMQWRAFVVAGGFAGLAGGLFAFSKGSISPDSTMAIPRSVDGLVMVLLGGLQTLFGPVLGAAVFTWLQDTLARNTEYWRALLGVTILAIVLLFPQGIGGAIAGAGRAREARMTAVPVGAILEVEHLAKSFGGVQAVATSRSASRAASCSR